MASEKDFDDIKRMCLDFHAASIYNEKPYDEDKIDALISEYLHLTADRIIILGILEGKSHGLLVASIQPILFSSAKMATETLWWVDADHRRSGLGIQLIEAFEYWAYEVQKADFSQISLLGDTPELDKLYTRLGYTLSEKAYLKERIKT